MAPLLIYFQPLVILWMALFGLHSAAGEFNCEKSISGVSFEQSYRSAINQLLTAEPRTQEHRVRVWERLSLELRGLRSDWTATRISGPDGKIAYVGTLFHALVFHPDGTIEKALIFNEDFAVDGSWTGAYHQARPLTAPSQNETPPLQTR